MSTEVRAKLKSIGTALKTMSGKLLKVSKSILKIGTALAGVSFAALTVGIKKALDLGGAMSDLASRTGESVSELVTMREAFRQAGASGDSLGITLDRLTRRTEIAKQGNNSYAKALEAAGLSADKLSGMSKLDRFKTVAEAFQRMTDKSKMTAAAMDLLDTSAGELFALFNDSNAFDKAAQSIGGQAALLEKNAETFDRASDILGGVGSKFQGFFVGVADKIQGTLLPLLERWDKLDFSGAGQAFGEKLRTVMDTIIEKSSGIFSAISDSFKAGNLGEMISLQVRVGLIKAMRYFSEKMVNVIAWIQGTLSDPKTWTAMGNAITSAIKVATGEVSGGMVGSTRAKSIVGSMGKNKNGLESDADHQRRKKALMDEMGIGKKEKHLTSTELALRILTAKNEKLAREAAGGGIDAEIIKRRNKGASGIFAGAATIAGRAGSRIAQNFGTDSGNTMGGGIAGMLANGVKKALQIALPVMDSAQMAGFSGLGRLEAMQSNLANGIGPGVSTFTGKVGRGGKGIGVQGATGLQGALGGLGAKSSADKAKEAADRKAAKEASEKRKSIEGTNDLLTEQNDLLRQNLTIAEA